MADLDRSYCIHMAGLNPVQYEIRAPHHKCDIRVSCYGRRSLNRPLAGYGLPPPRGNFVDHIFLKARCLARILQHVSPLTMAALSCNSLLHRLPYKIFDN